MGLAAGNFTPLFSSALIKAPPVASPHLIPDLSPYP